MKTESAPDRILIRCPNWVGDAVMATPALRAVRNCFPESHITLLCKPDIADVLSDLPFYDDTVDTPGKGRSTMSVASSLRKQRFDLALILTHSFRSALVARLAGVRRRVGYDLQGRGFLLTDALQCPMEGRKKRPEYMAEEYLRIVAYVGCKPSRRCPELAVAHEAVALAQKILGPADAETKGPLVGIAPGASFGPSKLWYPERWAAVADGLAERFDASIVILTAPADWDIYRQIGSRMSARPVYIDEKLMSLQLLKALVSRLNLLLCTDSGARHVAVAFGVPTVVIMGPTDPRYTATDCEKGVIIREEVDCGPCQKKVCTTDHRCMTQITSERVLEEASAVLEHHSTA